MLEIWEKAGCTGLAGRTANLNVIMKLTLSAPEYNNHLYKGLFLDAKR